MQTVLAGIVLLGILVFIHELGHFIVAKLCGVRVLTFSLGFGPKIFGFQYGETEYKISILPLGGFVRMFGENPEEELNEEEKKLSFLHQVLWKKAAIAAAGPIFNFILPVFVFWAMLSGTQERFQPLIGTVFEGGPAAAAELQAGDRVLAVDEKEIISFSNMVEAISLRPNQDVKIKIDRRGKTLDVTVHTLGLPSNNPIEKDQKVGRIGIGAGQQKATIAVLEKSPAAMAGLKTEDEIIKWDDEPIHSIHHLFEKLQTAPHQSHQLEIKNGDTTKTLLLPPIGPTTDLVSGQALPIPELETQRYAVTADELANAKQTIADTRTKAAEKLNEQRRNGGVAFFEGTIADIKDDTPAKALGLLKGDRIIAYDGTSFDAWATFHQKLTMAPDDIHYMVIERKGATFLTSFRMAPYHDPKMRGLPEKKVLGHVAKSAVHEPETFKREVSLVDAFPQAVDETYKIIALTLKGIWALLRFEIPLATLGGPIMIFDLAGKAAEQGQGMFLFLLCLISVNLGVLNLLPIPVLDGGHLLMFSIEAVQRKPISLATRALATRVGLFLLLALMVTAVGNDILRYFG
jgi:regulator of sigma E protease